MVTDIDTLVDDDGRLRRRAIARKMLEIAVYLGDKASPNSGRRVRDKEMERVRAKVGNSSIRAYKAALEASENADIDEMYSLIQDQVEDTSPFVDIEDWD